MKTLIQSVRFFKTESEGVLVYPFLLPLGLLFTMMHLGAIQPNLVTHFLPLLSCVTVFITVLFRIKGIFASYGIILLFLLCFPIENIVWHFSLFFSLAITLFIILLMSENLEEREQKEKEESKKNKEYIDSLKDMIQELTREVEQKRIDKAALEEPIYENVDFKSNYEQLRRQFEEKKAVLSETRMQLFSAETELLCKEREEKEQDLHVALKALERQWLSLYEEHLQLEEEVRLLEQLL